MIRRIYELIVLVGIFILADLIDPVWWFLFWGIEALIWYFGGKETSKAEPKIMIVKRMD